MEYLNELGFKIKKKDIVDGLKKVKWEGRLEIVEENPSVILDVAHNPFAFDVLFRELKRFYPEKKINLLIGVLSDKDYRKIVKISSGNCSFAACVKPAIKKGLEPYILRDLFMEEGVPSECFDSVVAGYDYLKSISEREDVILISGSHYIVGEFKRNYKIS
ncbi:hypothetical protein DRQ09_07225 [candidate division KSB1 bacterium]|nr:MAG: hypothetical protein DRQ09_07225 [candidate division KSB1 bacterium]